MFVAPCPHCGDSVTVPQRARPTSRVRCPLCTTEFTLDEMMAKLPPALELLDEPMGGYGEREYSYAGEVGGEGGVATLSATGLEDDVALADAEPRAEKPSYSFDGAGDTTTTAEPRKAVRTSPRPKKPKKNALLEGVKIILGGLMALPISQLILWWAAGRDPFELGPTIAQKAPYIAFVVPQKFHTAPGAKKKKDPSDTSNNSKPAKTEEKKAITGLPKLDNTEIPSIELPGDKKAADPTATLPVDDPLALPSDPSATPPDPLATDPLATDPLAPPSDPLTPMPPEKKATTTDPDPVPEPTPAVTPETTPADVEIVREAPRYTAAEVEEASKNASRAVQTWTEGSKDATTEAKTELLRSLYVTLAQLGEKVAHANRADTKLENHLPTIREMLYSLQAEPDVMTMITRVGPAWLNPRTRKNDGILAIGTVKQVVAQGKLFETKIELEDKAKTNLTIVSTTDPADSYKADERVMVLGVIISEPSNIVGYEGEAPLVVLSGMAVRVAQ